MAIRSSLIRVYTVCLCMPEFVRNMILCATQEKGPYTICGQCRSRSACASMQSDLGIPCSSTYTTVSIDSVSEQ